MQTYVYEINTVTSTMTVSINVPCTDLTGPQQQAIADSKCDAIVAQINANPGKSSPPQRSRAIAASPPSRPIGRAAEPCSPTRPSLLTNSLQI